MNQGTPGPATISRVDVTPAAETMLRQLVAQHGPLMFHQSGGCCDGSSPMCYPNLEFKIGGGDIFLGEIAGVPFYMGGQQFELWQHTHLTIDVVPGRGSGFSLEAPEGVRFLTRSRLFTAEELKLLEVNDPARRGGTSEE
ncbi:MAG: DUF779 domain-containing protein [Gemmatimonadota bacterium]